MSKILVCCFSLCLLYSQRSKRNLNKRILVDRKCNNRCVLELTIYLICTFFGPCVLCYLSPLYQDGRWETILIMSTRMDPLLSMTLLISVWRIACTFVQWRQITSIGIISNISNSVYAVRISLPSVRHGLPISCWQLLVSFVKTKAMSHFMCN